MYKKKIARLALCTALCALVTTSVFASPTKAKAKSHPRQPVKAVRQTAQAPAGYTHKQAVHDSATLRIGIREGRGSVAVTGPQGLGVYRGDMLWKKAAANVPVTIALSGTNLTVNGDVSTVPVQVRSLVHGGSVKITDGYAYRGALEMMKSPGRWGLTVVVLRKMSAFHFSSASLMTVWLV